MSVAVKVFDKSFGGPRTFARHLRLASDTLTARQVIERRIDEEMIEFEAAQKSAALEAMPIVPTFVETILNGMKTYGKGRVGLPDFHTKAEFDVMDRQQQLSAALTALESQKLLMLVDNRQVTSPDQSITLTENSTITFIKLVPLVSG